MNDKDSYSGYEQSFKYFVNEFYKPQRGFVKKLYFFRINKDKTVDINSSQITSKSYLSEKNRRCQMTIKYFNSLYSYSKKCPHIGKEEYLPDLIKHQAIVKYCEFSKDDGSDESITELKKLEKDMKRTAIRNLFSGLYSKIFNKKL